MKILMDGLFYNGSGFAEDNLSILNIFEKLGHEIQIMARDENENSVAITGEQKNHLENLIKNKINEPDIYFINLMGSGIVHPTGFKKTIARTAFETDRIPSEWVGELNKFDEIWVLSTFNVETFKKSGVTTPVFRVPCYQDAAKKLISPKKQKETYQFLSVFDWQIRKGYPFLIRGFLEAFSKEENVELVIKTYHRSDRSKIETEIQKLKDKVKKKNKPKITLINETISRTELEKLYENSDAFVLPSRGEGWGKPYFEAMLFGLPTIGTAWGGQLDFMHSENSFLIDVKTLIGIRNNDVPLFNGHQWAYPSLESLKKQMRFVYENQEAAIQIGMIGRKELMEKYHTEALRKIIEKRLKSLI